MMSSVALYTPQRFKIRQESPGKTIGQGAILYRQSACLLRAVNSKTMENRKLSVRSDRVRLVQDVYTFILRTNYYHVS